MILRFTLYTNTGTYLHLYIFHYIYIYFFLYRTGTVYLHVIIISYIETTLNVYTTQYNIIYIRDNIYVYYIVLLKKKNIISTKVKKKIIAQCGAHIYNNIIL